MIPIRQSKRRRTVDLPKPITFVYSKKDQKNHAHNNNSNNKKPRTIPGGVTTVVLENGVTEISSRSLEDLTDLTKLDCSGTRRKLQTIGESALEDCMSLETVFGLPPSLESIQKNAFLLCESLTEVKLPRIGLKVIGEGAFASCSSLETMEVPTTVETIGNCAFASCTSLSNLTFHVHRQNGSRLTHIGDRAFSCCSSLAKVELPPTVQFIGKSAFELCTVLRTVELVLCNELRNIEEFTFAWCKRLKVVILPYSLFKIHRGAFKGCARLKEIPLPPQLQAIGSEAFYNSGLQVFNVPSSVTIIESSAFQHCHSLGEVELREGLKEIGNWAFANCKTLRAVFLPSSLELVGDGAFRDCLNLLGVEIPQNVQVKLGQYVFQHCKSLYSISLSANCTKSFPETTFAGCCRLKTFNNKDDEHAEGGGRRQMLMDITTLSPVHKAVYFSRGVSTRRLKSKLAEECSSPSSSSLHESTGISPFHALVASPELRHDIFLALLDQCDGNVSILCRKDLWGKTMMDHLLQVTTHTITPKVVSFFKLIIQKTVVDRIHQWGLSRQQWEIDSCVQAIAWDDDTAIPHKHIATVYQEMGRFERHESLSILELALWKAKRRSDGNHQDGKTSSSEEERMVCGSAIAIPFVMPYLWKADSTPPPPIAFASSFD